MRGVRVVLGDKTRPPLAAAEDPTFGGARCREVAGSDSHRDADTYVRKLAALDHRVDRGAAHAEPLGDLADRQELLREHDAGGGPEPRLGAVFGGP